MKRAQFIARLRRLARKQGLPLTIIEKRGKGSHITVALGGRRTILKSGELQPGYVRVVLRQLGLPPGAL